MLTGFLAVMILFVTLWAMAKVTKTVALSLFSGLGGGQALQAVGNKIGKASTSGLNPLGPQAKIAGALAGKAISMAGRGADSRGSDAAKLIPGGRAMGAGAGGPSTAPGVGTGAPAASRGGTDAFNPYRRGTFQKSKDELTSTYKIHKHYHDNSDPNIFGRAANRIRAKGLHAAQHVGAAINSRKANLAAAGSRMRNPKAMVPLPSASSGGGAGRTGPLWNDVESGPGSTPAPPAPPAVSAPQLPPEAAAHRIAREMRRKRKVRLGSAGASLASVRGSGATLTGGRENPSVQAAGGSAVPPMPTTTTPDMPDRGTPRPAAAPALAATAKPRTPKPSPSPGSRPNIAGGRGKMRSGKNS